MWYIIRRSSVQGLRRAHRALSYVQGQAPEPKVREYFYYIDHQGQLFMDDTRIKNFVTCFKDKKFLEFFFKRLKINDMTRYSEDFPYLSPCGRERNFIRCDDRPIVFSHILEPTDSDDTTGPVLSYNGGGDKLTFPFSPDKLCMLPRSGRVYHPAPAKVGGVGLVKSSLAIELSRDFRFGDEGEYAPPVGFLWRGQEVQLTNELWDLMTDEEKKELRAT
ncbi:UPF0598 protein CG30010-like [Branchiostoma floridae]|uniref:UPF0598 protein CG30010-like n=2 Tax=Branchiostoma floridae TaxID=7739 RepID=A0A9J7MTD2_BRAFL|nr:UPF0598 protein CG30010-like [Branchiostoma floridae]